jgi:hypothetical protein
MGAISCVANTKIQKVNFTLTPARKRKTRRRKNPHVYSRVRKYKL